LGAQVGSWTELALRASPGAEVHCFEPMRDSFERLAARGFPPSVVLNRLALSDAEGEAVIHARSASLHSRRLSPRDAAPDGEGETVRLTTLSAYCEQRGIEEIDLLKIDAEGHDLAILHGGEAMIREGRIRRIQFEYGPPNVYARVLLRDFYAFFHDLPYAIFQVTPHGLAPFPAYPLHLENFQYKNFAALHHSLRP
jgi:FkbM family methyltransferase